MSQLNCGIDLGSTNVKVTLVDESARAVWTKAVPTPRQPDGPGVATDAPGLLALVESMIIEGWREHGRSRPLRAIAAAGVGEDGVGLRADFTPTDLSLPWFDNRAKHQASDLQRASIYAAQAGQPIDPSRTAAKWLWLRQNRPEVLASTDWWVALTDYPAVAWTGNVFMSETLAARTACYDVYARRWIEPLLLAAGSPNLPVVVPAGHILGGVEKGPLRESGAASASTIVAAGGHDHMIAAAAIRRLHPQALVDSMGTANLAYGETRVFMDPKLDPYVAYSVPALGGPGLSCLGVFELASAIDRLRSTPDRVGAVLAAERIPGSPGEEISGRPTDVDVRHGLEQATFYARRMFEAILESGAEPGPIFAAGGWSRSHAFMELRASIYGQAVSVVDEPELTAVGAALVAMNAAGDAVNGFGAGLIRTEIEPVPAWIETYAELYAEYRAHLDAATRERLFAQQ